jgi:O-antigen ligase
MLDLRSKQILGTVTLAAVAAVTLVVAPYTLLDPMGLPKLTVLAFFAVVALSLMVPAIKNLFSSSHRILVILLSLFILQIILVLLFSGANIGAQFYGTYTRNTGALAYTSLVVLLLSASLVSNKEFLKKFICTTLIIGAILIVYGNIQYLGLEPFPYVNAYAVNAPIGTFGNSNFQAAFMGLIAVVAFTMVLNSGFKPLTRLGLAITGFAAIVVVYETLSNQGYLNFIAGAGVVIMLWLFMSKRKSLAIAVAGLGVIGGGLVFLGLINSGPLAKYIYESSIAARGYYWRAAIKMLIEHPIFGVGMDNYGTWYGRNRQVGMENGFSTYSNSAHNVYLDLASNGGFPLLVIYLAIAVLVIVAVVRVIQRNDGLDAYFLATVGAWVAYHVQSFISINQLGLAIWGWILSGLIIGYEINTRVRENSQSAHINRKQKGNRARSSAQPLSPRTVISILAGVLIGAIVAGPLFIANAQFYSAMKADDIKAVESVGNQRPHDERRLFMLAGIFRNAALDDQAIKVLREATMEYPDSLDLWNLWLTIPTASPADLATAKAQLKRLDPFNPAFK